MAWLPELRSPMGQVILIGAVCFCCPGMFSALTGMGGGGQVDPHAADAALTALYSTFAVFGLLGGGFNNIFGPRITALIGSVFYALYAAAFLHYNHSRNQNVVIAAGGFLGFGAGLLWAAQGAILMAYPPRHSKGLYISVFWSVFNMGGVVGGLIPLTLNFRDDRSTSVNDATYIAFMLVMLFGSVLSLALVQPHQIVIAASSAGQSSLVHPSFRSGEESEEDRLIPPRQPSILTESEEDTSPRQPSILTESAEMLKLFSDKNLLAFVPACIASNFFYTYQFNNVNGVMFNVRTRGLNNVIYWGAQMLGSTVLGCLLDRACASRKARGAVGIGLVAAISTLVWSGALANQLHYSRANPPAALLDFTDGRVFLGPFALYACFGLLDAMYQSLCYWVMGESGGPRLEVLSRYGGFYKGLQSAGAAVAWMLDARKMPFKSQLLINWILMTLSFPLLGVMIRDLKDA